MLEDKKKWIIAIVGNILLILIIGFVFFTYFQDNYQRGYTMGKHDCSCPDRVIADGNFIGSVEWQCKGSGGGLDGVEMPKAWYSQKLHEQNCNITIG